MKKPLIANIEIGGPFQILARQVWIKDRNRTPPALEEPIAATAVQASSSDTGSPAINLINRSGLRDFNFDGLNEHDSNPAHMWRSAKGDAKGWVEFDLGQPQTLTAISVWNYNEIWHIEQGVRNMRVSVWTQAAGWQTIRETLQVDQAEGCDGYDEPTIIKFDPTTAQKVRLDGLVSLGDPQYIGLSKVQFFGPAGPKAVKLVKLSPDDGAEGVGVHNLELTWISSQGAKVHNVYLGTSTDELKLLGKVEQAGVKLSQLKCDTKYYWRVDGVRADGSVMSGPVCSFTTGGLAGWWKLDETEGTKAADSSGNRHDGAAHGNPTWQPRGGKVAGGLQLDGMQDFVDTGWAADLATWTVGVWGRSPSSPASAPVSSGPVDRQANFQINWNHRRSELRGAAGLRIGETWHGASFGSLDPGTWYHLVATFDGRSLRAYKDGVLVSENSGASGRPAHDPATLKLGRNAVAEGYFAGTIDDVCICTYAFTADEVKALYSGKEPTTIAGGSAPSVPSLVVPTATK